jgi:hypothetical protein
MQTKRLDMKERRRKQAKITILGKGSVFGDEDLTNRRPYSSSLACSMNNSCVYLLSKHQFELWFLKSELHGEVQGLAHAKEVSSKGKYSHFLKMTKANENATNKKYNIKNNLLVDQQETEVRFQHYQIVLDFPYASGHRKLMEHSPDERYESLDRYKPQGVSDHFDKVLQRDYQPFFVQPYVSSRITNLLDEIDKGRVDRRELRLCLPLSKPKVEEVPVDRHNESTIGL